MIDHAWLHPLDYAFMRRGLAAAVCVGLACGLIGPYMVLRRLSVMGHALTHSALPGLVWAHGAGVPLFLGALGANLLTILGVSRASRREESREDSLVALASNAMFALGLVMMARTRSYRDLSHLLFGNILGVGDADLAMMAGVALLVIGTLAIYHKEWELIAVDPIQARMIGLPLDRMRGLLLLLLVLTVVAGIQAVGTVLTGALLVAPASTAFAMTSRFSRVMIGSASVAVASGIIGLALSYLFGYPSGASIVLVSTGFYIAARIVHRRKGHDRHESH
jgi:manganese/iron transport system permease protein